MFFKKKPKQPQNKKLNTKSLQGTLELLPEDQIYFDSVVDTLKEIYESFGFVPIDTPAIEREEILTAKVGEETSAEIYKIKKGDKNLGLRFDLTVPLARYVSDHFNDLVFPFRRYQIAKVYRGERPQRGRFREFYQCDIDIIGEEELSIANEAEVVNVMYTVLKKLNVGPFVIKISNRNILAGFIESIGLADKSSKIMASIDKIEKIGRDAVAEILQKEKIEKEKINKILNFISAGNSNAEILDNLKKEKIDNENFKTGVEDLQKLIAEIEKNDIPNDNYKIDLKIVRGLDYYNGTVFETFLVEDPKLGSIYSGGRYSDLVGKYSDQKLPGIGVSIGLSRLFVVMREKGIFQSTEKTKTKVAIVPLTSDLSASYKLAKSLRNKKINTEIVLEDFNMKKKLNYVNKKKIKFAVIIGEDEITTGQYAIKNMETGDQQKMPAEKIAEFIQN